jgi:uncharacterized protein YukE
VSQLSWQAMGERCRALSAGARSAAGEMDARRAALSRSALVWWQGEAAESYQQRVQDRVNGLAALAARLEALAVLGDELAAAAEAQAAAERSALTTGRPG